MYVYMVCVRACVCLSRERHRVLGRGKGEGGVCEGQGRERCLPHGAGALQADHCQTEAAEGRPLRESERDTERQCVCARVCVFVCVRRKGGIVKRAQRGGWPISGRRTCLCVCVCACVCVCVCGSRKVMSSKSA